MSTLKETLQADLTRNFKAGNELEKTVLRSVLGEIQTQEKGGKTAVEFDDEKVLQVLSSEAKKRRATANEYAGAGVMDRAERENAEADFLAQYLPVALTEAEVAVIVDEVLASLDDPNFGLVMKNVVARTKGKADGKLVSQLVKSKMG